MFKYDTRKNYKAYNTCKTMVQMRGYTLTYEDIEHLIFEASKGDEDSLIMFIDTSDKLNVNEFRNYYMNANSKGIPHIIILYNKHTHAVLRNIECSQIEVELFSILEMQYNILEHAFVPKHEYVQTIKSNKMKYPILLRTDPVSRFMGFKTGDIVRIYRKDGSLYYRYVK